MEFYLLYFLLSLSDKGLETFLLHGFSFVLPCKNTTFIYYHQIKSDEFIYCQ